MKLLQRSGLDKRTFELMDDGVCVRIDSFNKGGTYTIPYTVIPHTPNEITSSSTILMAMALIPLGMTCICGLYWLTQPKISFNSFEAYSLLTGLVTGFVFLTMFLTRRKTVLVYSDGNGSFSIKADSPNRDTVNQFVTEMGNTKLSYFEKCLRRAIDADPTINAKSAIISLMQGGYITESQADQLSGALNTDSNPTASFGFVASTSTKSA